MCLHIAPLLKPDDLVLIHAVVLEASSTSPVFLAASIPAVTPIPGRETQV
jgi:hypothetical protein